MAQLLVDQLRFARSELERCLAGVSEEEATLRLMPMNCISWVVGHLASHENRVWIRMAQGEVIAPELGKLVGYGKPASTPALKEMRSTWHTITAAADIYLEGLTTEQLTTFLEPKGEKVSENIGTLLLRNIYHYWFHIGEAHAMRQQIGHQNLPDFVGDMSKVEYHP